LERQAQRVWLGRLAQRRRVQAVSRAGRRSRPRQEARRALVEPQRAASEKQLGRRVFRQEARRRVEVRKRAWAPWEQPATYPALPLRARRAACCLGPSLMGRLSWRLTIYVTLAVPLACFRAQPYSGLTFLVPRNIE
jgi:hypothetical protein